MKIEDFTDESLKRNLIDEESRSVYRAKVLSYDLRTAIVESSSNRHSIPSMKILRPAAILASLVVIVSVLVQVFPNVQNKIYTGDTLVTGDNIPAVTETITYKLGINRMIQSYSMDDREMSSRCIPLRIRFGENVTVSVNNGYILLHEDAGEIIYAGTFTSVKNDEIWYWCVEGCENASPLTCEIISSSGNVTASLVLAYDAENNLWTIVSENE